LFFVAPLVAEFLLGNLPINLFGALVVLAPFYGGGALLIREMVRRTGRGWPSIFVLAFSYAIFEEAFTTQSLFNPNYLHLNMHLLDHAYLPVLGIGAWWTVFVLTLHTVWSIPVSIGLVEALVPDRATTPWLRGIGLGVASVLFALAAVATTVFGIKQDRFVASVPQFAVAAAICVITAVVAFRLPKASAVVAMGWVPSPWWIGASALIAGSVFMVVPPAWGWGAVGIYLFLDFAMTGIAFVMSRRAGWNSRHRLALAGGAALAYAWHAFIETPAVGGAGRVDRIGNVIFAAGLIVMLAFAARRTSSPSTVRRIAA
jgi:hypothetical protein